MINRKRIYISFIVFFLSNLFLCHLVAQGTKATHAESKSKVWKGMDVDSIKDNSKFATNGKKFYLYNVGTGHFVIEGGEWGMEGRLFHETFGRQMSLRSDSYILSGITESTNDKKIMFGCNVPAVSKDKAKWSDALKYCFYTVMDAHSDWLAKWEFEPVTSDPDNNTYYMKEHMKNRQAINGEAAGVYHDYYLGAAYGERHYGNKNGKLIYLDYDRSCWTTEDIRNNETKVDVNGEMIAINKLYQWRLIPEEEFLEELQSTKVGLNPSISCLVPDRDFPRNSNNFDDHWKVETLDGADYNTKGRRGYTNGIYLNGAKQDKYYSDEPWNKPIRLKEVFDNTDGNTLQYGLENSRYGYLLFEGVGRTYTEFELPNAGWYLVECYGFLKSTGNYDAYLFAQVRNTESGAVGDVERNHLVKLTAEADSFQNKNTRAGCLPVGKVLTKPKSKGPYKNLVWICVTEDDFDAGFTTLRLGVEKEQATKSAGEKNGNIYYYYDTDWVCIDDIRVSFMGLAPCFFYEDEEDLEYLRFDPVLLTNSTAQLPSAAPNGRYSGAACIERAFQTGKWNTFSFPFQLTGEQMRHAFGDNTKLAKLHSIGLKSQHSNVIDFETVDLFTTEYVVEPGTFYLLKPANDPLTGKDPKGNEKEYYELGRLFFSVNDTEPDSYNHPKMSLTTFLGMQSVSSLNNENNGTGYGNYIQTPDYDSFRVTNGIYNGSTANGIYAPKGSYAVGYDNNNNTTTIYHLGKDTRIKGFRGWITLDHELQAEAKPMSLCFDGIEDSGGITTEMEDLLVPIGKRFDDTAVYDLTGRKVGTLGTSLPKGMYIVRGKKFFVK